MSWSAVKILLMLCPAALLMLVVLAAYLLVKYLHVPNQLHRYLILPAWCISSISSPATLPVHYGVYSEMKSTEVGRTRPSAYCGECALCFDGFVAEDKCVQLVECWHVFHDCCGKAWLEKKSFCPVCHPLKV